MTTVETLWRGDEFVQDMERAVRNGMEDVGRVLQQRVRRNLNLLASNKSAKDAKPSPAGEPPANRTGNLFASIIHMVEDSGKAVRVGVSSDNPANNYAMIHEFGGQITAKNAEYLKFELPDGEYATVQAVDMPARPYLRPSLRSAGDDMQNAFNRSVTRTLRSTGWLP